MKGAPERTSRESFSTFSAKGSVNSYLHSEWGGLQACFIGKFELLGKTVLIEMSFVRPFVRDTQIYLPSVRFALYLAPVKRYKGSMWPKRCAPRTCASCLGVASVAR